MSEPASSSSGKRFSCPNCGGGLKYDILAKSMVCSQCGSQTELAQLEDGPDSGEMMEVTEYHCPQCGAMVYSADTSVTGFCSFCGSDVILTGRLGHTRRPAAIVPFFITREDCEQRYREYLRHYRLMPAELESAETVSHFRPVYVPFWSYHVQSKGPAELMGFRAYIMDHYHYTEDYKLSMDAEINQEGILYDASTVFEDETAAMLQHKAYYAVPFHSAYLCGFYAQSADVPPETYEEEAAATAARLFMDQVKENYKMDSVEITGDIRHSFGLPNARFEKKLVMLPVWLLAHRQGQRVVYTAVNGFDGKVVCDVPVSSGKIAVLTGIITLVLFLLLNTLVTLKPDLLMLLCGLLLLLVQILFTGAHTVLNNRRTRAFEPDFSGEHPVFKGPAQAMLKMKEDSVAIDQKAPGQHPVKAWFRRKPVPWATLVVFLLCMLYAAISSGLLSHFLSSFRFRYMLDSTYRLLGCMLILLVIMVIYTVVTMVKKKGGGPLLPRLLSCIACGAGVLFLYLRQTEDLLYYGCTAAMLLAAIWELLTITRAHNEYASRPVPFFKEESA